MAMFASQGSTETAGPGGQSALTILARGMRVTGELETDGVIKIEGTVVGTVRARGQVLVAKGGVIEGDVFTREAVIGGRVKGSIHADERVEVQGGSHIEGDVTTPRLVVQEGGELNGQLTMARPKAKGQSETGTGASSSTARNRDSSRVLTAVGA